MNQLQLNTKLQDGKYVIKKVLGQGGFGITYLAEQTMLGKQFAIKEFFIRDLCARDDSATVYSVTQSDMVDRYRLKFIKEAQIIARFNHPGIVKVFDIFEENGTVYYVMEYVKGESLAEIVKREGHLSEQTALQYIYKVSDALDYIHQSNVNHLDIKPNNIMIRKADNEPILIDFGVSKQYDEKKDQTTTTPPGVSYGYSPLEQYKPGGVSIFSPQADIYALGATLFKLLTGTTPPIASDLLNDGLPPIPNVSPNLRKAIEKAMQPRISERPEKISEFVEILKNTSKNEEQEESIDDETGILGAKTDSERETDSEGETDGEGEYDSDDKRDYKPLIFILLFVFVILFTIFLIHVNNNDDTTTTEESTHPNESVSDSTGIGFYDQEYSTDSEEEVFDSSHIFSEVEQQPSFPGGQGALLSWLSYNIHYPPVAEENGIQGKVVVSFVVEPDGSISNVAVVRGVDPTLDQETVRVVKSMPKWNPGKQNGQAVRVKYNLPITFELK